MSENTNTRRKHPPVLTRAAQVTPPDGVSILSRTGAFPQSRKKGKRHARPTRSTGNGRSLQSELYASNVLQKPETEQPNSTDQSKPGQHKHVPWTQALHLACIHSLTPQPLENNPHILSLLEATEDGATNAKHKSNNTTIRSHALPTIRHRRTTVHDLSLPGCSNEPSLRRAKRRRHLGE